MQTIYIGSRNRADGYWGKQCTVYLCLDGNRLLEAHRGGYHTSPALPMDIQDAAEANWLLDNHPYAKRFYTKLGE